MTKMRDPYLAGWNDAVEAAALAVEEQKDTDVSYRRLWRIADAIRALAKPEIKE